MERELSQGQRQWERALIEAHVGGGRFPPAPFFSMLGRAAAPFVVVFAVIVVVTAA